MQQETYELHCDLHSPHSPICLTRLPIFLARLPVWCACFDHNKCHDWQPSVETCIIVTTHVVETQCMCCHFDPAIGFCLFLQGCTQTHILIANRIWGWLWVKWFVYQCWKSHTLELCSDASKLNSFTQMQRLMACCARVALIFPTNQICCRGQVDDKDTRWVGWAPQCHMLPFV